MKKQTTGDRVAEWTQTWDPAWLDTAAFRAKLARRIDRAIASAVRKDRERRKHGK